MIKAKTVGILGCGNMGEAILSGCRQIFPVVVSEQNARRRRDLKRRYRVAIHSIDELARACSIIILAVKPQDFQDVLTALKPCLTKRHLVISIAAGITLAYLEQQLGRGVRVVRAMPNLPAVVKQSMTVLARGRFATAQDLRLACSLFHQIGRTLIVTENYLNAVTAISGSGPGYIYFLMEQMIQAAQEIGLNSSMAKLLTEQTYIGSMALYQQARLSPEVLRARVTSKGGTTQAALDVFQQKHIDKIFVQAFQAAVQRAQQLSRR